MVHHRLVPHTPHQLFMHQSITANQLQYSSFKLQNPYLLKWTAIFIQWCWKISKTPAKFIHRIKRPVLKRTIILLILNESTIIWSNNNSDIWYQFTEMKECLVGHPCKTTLPNIVTTLNVVPFILTINRSIHMILWVDLYRLPFFYVDNKKCIVYYV